jgi:hypothetical protein
MHSARQKQGSMNRPMDTVHKKNISQNKKKLDNVRCAGYIHFHGGAPGVSCLCSSIHKHTFTCEGRLVKLSLSLLSGANALNYPYSAGAPAEALLNSSTPPNKFSSTPPNKFSSTPSNKFSSTPSNKFSSTPSNNFSKYNQGILGLQNSACFFCTSYTNFLLNNFN